MIPHRFFFIFEKKTGITFIVFPIFSKEKLSVSSQHNLHTKNWQALSKTQDETMW